MSFTFSKLKFVIQNPFRFIKAFPIFVFISFPQHQLPRPRRLIHHILVFYLFIQLNSILFPSFHQFSSIALSSSLSRFQEIDTQKRRETLTSKHTQTVINDANTNHFSYPLCWSYKFGRFNGKSSAFRFKNKNLGKNRNKMK